MHATMKRVRQMLATTMCAAVLAVLAIPAAAQEGQAGDSPSLAPNPSAPAVTDRAVPRVFTLSHYRPHDARAIDQFEWPKDEGAPYKGFTMEWGAAFTQQFQGLSHKDDPTPLTPATTLMPIGSGFNNADANLYMDAQLAKGIRVAMTSYLSSRHHNETWVKDGYLLIDGAPWENPTLDRLMQTLTLRVGHFEINYGDAHFRRSDNGQAMFNPFVGNLLMDAFTTEIGAEVYARRNGYLGMIAVTGGEVRGTVLKPDSRSPSVMGKFGFDRQVKPDVRVRLTGSFYTTHTSANNTLYTGSRAGSRFYYVLENINASDTGNAWSGDVRPDFSSRVTAFVANPFVKVRGLELFGNIEQARGRSATETVDRAMKQWAGEALYRFCRNQLYVAGRFNQANGRLLGMPNDVKVQRIEGSAGWFITTNLEAKTEYVRQDYTDFPAASIFHEGQFHGVMFEAVVSF
jgi:hypothetical protein